MHADLARRLSEDAFSPKLFVILKKYPRNINYMPVVIFSDASILEKIAILGQLPSTFKRGQQIKDLQTLSPANWQKNTCGFVQKPFRYRRV